MPVVRSWARRAAAGLSIAALPAAGCGCEEQVVADAPYRYSIAGTAEHCADATAPCPATNDAVTYLWPVTNAGVDADPHAPLTDVIDDVDGLFSLPFNDTAVARSSGWLYKAGDWHHALDFGRADGGTFPVRAAADGRVLFAGWDPWSGNTVVVSHAAGGVDDAYRTIYMHLRDGPDQDCERSWTTGLAAVRDDDAEEEEAQRNDYKAHLNTSGCPASGVRLPSALHWGTDAHALSAGVGRAVTRGEQIGWAGATGPGGQRKPGPPNTHLHLFVARKSTADNAWYFLDPYGLYGESACYPADVTASADGARGVAWRDGRPQYPVERGCGSGPECLPGFRCEAGTCVTTLPNCGGKPPCMPGFTCTEGACVAACEEVCPVLPPDLCLVEPDGDCVRQQSVTERKDCTPVGGACLPPCFLDAQRACRIDETRMETVACAKVCAQ